MITTQNATVQFQKQHRARWRHREATSHSFCVSPSYYQGARSYLFARFILSFISVTFRKSTAK